MKRRQNIAASVKQRLLNHARERREDFNLLLTRYGTERLLYRLSRSEHGTAFVVKGAVLFNLWTAAPHRPTRDLDLLGQGSPSPQLLEEVFRAVCATDVDDDGIRFLTESVRAERIRDEAPYQGVRILMEGRLAAARIHLQVDVGFGDSIVPAPELVDFPVLLEQPAPRLLAYRRESVVAEKLHAMVELGMANSRMKDFFDIRFLSVTFAFGGTELTRALEATFKRRQTPLPAQAPTALTDVFSQDEAKRTQWRAFTRRSRLEDKDIGLGEVVTELRVFLLPPIEALADGKNFAMKWAPGGPWESDSAAANVGTPP